MTERVASLPSGWGPESKAGALSFTFDNMGEAADIEFGLWPADRDVGGHYSVVDALPKILEILGDTHATFFIEAWNTGHYADALRSIVAAGHEIGMHGWRHELWDKVPEADRPALLHRCREAMESIGLKPIGFRPPGGPRTPDLDGILHDEGCIYHSSTGEQWSVEDGIAALPFTFPDIDGFQIEAGMGGLAQEGESEAESLARLRTHVMESIDRAVAAGTHRMLIFHPWIIGKSAARLDALAEILRTVRQRDDIWIAPARDVARFVLDTAGTA